MFNKIQGHYSKIFLAATILAAILDFSLIAGVWKVYPRYFLPSGDVAIEKKSSTLHIIMHTGPLSADGSYKDR